MEHEVILRDAATQRWLLFRSPRQIITSQALDEVLPALRHLEALVEKNGWYAAGLMSYEAAPACDSALRVPPATDFPLLWFGLYDAPLALDQLPFASPVILPTQWTPSLDLPTYHRAIAHIKDHIARGNTYQVNYTLRLRAAFDGNAWGLFAALNHPQPAPYAAFVDLGRYAVCSFSPELFFHRSGQVLTTRPMKGTAPRRPYLAADRAQARRLRRSAKNRAENVMIVDMLRNDLGKVAVVGSVHVPHLFEIERYPTVWQMTSTVQARSDAPLAEVMRALFPCASVTGAPKPATMRLITALEPEARRIYTGCLGFLAPGRQAQFNVAIRTVLVDRLEGEAEYGVGGGIVWDSRPDEEYAECQHKARLLTERQPEFALLESLRWTPEEGYFLLTYHLRRLRDSARYFDYPLKMPAIQRALAAEAKSLPPVPHKVRLLLDARGQISVQSAPIQLPTPTDPPLRLGIAPQPVHTNDRFLYHKTTYQRAVFDALLAAQPQLDDVILWNERGEVTESCAANLVFHLDGELVTPPLSSGLLPGTLRAWLLERGEIREAVVTLERLRQCEAIFRINSVRGWQRARLP